MSKILLIASAVLLLASGGLSVANKNRLTASMQDADAAHKDAASAHADVTKTRTALTKSQAETKEVGQKLTDAQAQLEPLQAQVTKLNGDVEAANKLATDKETQLKELNDKLAQASSDPTKQIDPTQIAAQIDTLKREKEELQVVKEGLENRTKAAEDQLAKANKAEQDRRLGVTRVGLQGRVLAVDRNWNFVVLSIGDQQGVNSNATMVVQRGGSLVGRVRITSVEPTQSIADIIPNSVPAGVTVQAGDTVVFPSS